MTPQEIWDNHADVIGSGTGDFDRWVCTSVLTQEGFKLAIAEAIQAFLNLAKEKLIIKSYLSEGQEEIAINSFLEL